MSRVSWLSVAVTLVACTNEPDSAPVDAPPEAAVTAPEDGAVFRQGDDSIVLTGTVDDSFDAPADLSVTWNVDGDIAIATDVANDGTATGVVDATTLTIGEHAARLQVIDSAGATAYAHVAFTIVGPTGAPTVGITEPGDGIELELGRPVELVAEASDESTAADALTFQWSSDLDGPLAGAIDAAGQSVLTTSSLTAGKHVVTVQVTDGDGEVAEDTIAVTVVDPPLPTACGAENQTLVYATDFDAGSLPEEFSGDGELTAVQGWDGLGDGEFMFAGDMVRNATIPARPLRLDLEGLPPHQTIRIGFLFAMIDSWDGNGWPEGPDGFEVLVDDDTVFAHAFAACCGTSDYYPPAGGVLSSGTQLGFNSSADMAHDAAYDMFLEPDFHDIPHTSSSVEIEWSATGPHWQGGTDESWAIDALCISVGE